MTKAMRLDRWAGAWALSALSWLSLAGCALLAAMLFLGFERLPDTAFTVSGLLMLSLPCAVLLHLLTVSRLEHEEKMAWLRELASPRFPWTAAAYLRCRDRAALARRMARRRRPEPKH